MRIHANSLLLLILLSLTTVAIPVNGQTFTVSANGGLSWVIGNINSDDFSIGKNGALTVTGKVADHFYVGLRSSFNSFDIDARRFVHLIPGQQITIGMSIYEVAPAVRYVPRNPENELQPFMQISYGLYHYKIEATGDNPELNELLSETESVGGISLATGFTTNFSSVVNFEVSPAFTITQSGNDVSTYFTLNAGLFFR